MSYIKENFLLTNKTAERLYFGYAKDMPIFDYHCHLPEKQILANESFNDVYEIWLAGDHYKWRLMRNYGINEEYITGNKSNKEKFIAYCTVLGTAFGNPLYHWSQVELKEFFNCEIEINEQNAELIWDWCNEFIKVNHITPQKLIEGSNVKCLFTTNEVFDDTSTFEKIKDNFEIHYIGSKTGIEKEIINKYKFITYHPITTVKLERKFTFKNLLIPFKLIKGICDSKNIIKSTCK